MRTCRAKRRSKLRSERARGFALLIVLWALFLLTLLTTHLIAAGRGEARIAANLMSNAAAEAAADGVIYEAAFHLIDRSNGHWEPDGKPRRLRLDGGEAVVRIESEAGKVNPNTASPELLASLLQSIGVGANNAVRLANAIADWHEPGDVPRPGGAKLAQYRAANLGYGPPGEPFESLDELGRVLGVTPELFTALRPHLSLYSYGDPDPGKADPVVLATLMRLPGGVRTGLPAKETPGLTIATINADVRMASGARFTRSAILGASPALVHGYVILGWESHRPE